MLLCLTFVGCKPRSSEGEAAKLPEAWITYPIKRQVEEHEDFTGKTEAENSVVVKARATGHLKKVNFKDGSSSGPGAFPTAR